MQPFKYTEGHDVPAAVSGYSLQTTEYLAGGTTLVDLMKLHVMTPSQLIDITQIPLRQIRDQGDCVEVDALVNNNEMAHHPMVKRHFPLVSEALLSGASVQLRNLATTSGNILQKTRCSYFRDLGSKCNKRNPGSGCDAMNGYNRMHAVVGGSDHCIASHPSDLCVALMAVGAVVNTEGSQGKREIPFEKFYTLPGDTPHIENVLTPGELIVSVSLPKKECFKRSTYVKIRDRSSYAFALVSAAVALETVGGKVKEARIAFGGIGTVPWRASSAEALLLGQALTPGLIKEAARSVTMHAKLTSYNKFKVALAEQTLIRAFQEVEIRS